MGGGTGAGAAGPGAVDANLADLEREKNNAVAVLLGSCRDTAPTLEDRSLLAGEEVVEDRDVLDERPKLLLSRGAVLKTIEAGMKRCESGAAKQGSQCCNEPNQR